MQIDPSIVKDLFRSLDTSARIEIGYVDATGKATSRTAIVEEISTDYAVVYTSAGHRRLKLGNITYTG